MWLIDIFKSGPDLPYGDPRRPTLRRRILYTILLVAVFRLLAAVPVFNVEEDKLHELLADNPLIASLDLLAGGDLLSSFSLVAAGILPYLLALGLMKAATRLVPALRELEEKGASGKARLERITKLVTIPLAFVLAWGLTHSVVAESGFFPGKIHWFTGSRFVSTFGIVGLMTLGTLITMGITTLISNWGVGNGESVILIVGSCIGFVGQIADLIFAAPDAASATRQLALRGIVIAIVVGLILFLFKRERRVPMRAMSHPEYEGNFLPLLPNHGGVLPITSAVGLIAVLAFGANYLGTHFAGKFAAVQHGLAVVTDPERGGYWVLLGVLVVLLVYAHNFSVLWKPSADSDATLTQNLRRTGFFVPGIRPGAATEAYLSAITLRLSLTGAVTLAFIAAALPYAVLKLTAQNVFVIVLAVFVFGQTLRKLRPEITAHAIEGQYGGLLKRGRIRK